MYFIRKFFVILPFLFLFLFGCAKQKRLLYFESQVLENGLIEIYSINEKEKIYSTFTEINYQVDRKTKISLGEALEKNLISIDDIISKMELVSAKNDGGSLSFKYSVNNNGLSSQDFVLVKCDSLEINGGIKNIYIGNEERLEELEKYCVNYDE